MSDHAMPIKRTKPLVKRRNYGAWVLAGLIVFMGVGIVNAGIQARILDLDVLVRYLVSGDILRGAWNAILLGTLSFLIACVVGLAVALMRLSGNPILTAFAAGYVYIFRGIPMLIQLLFWFNAFPILFSSVTLSIPFTDIVLAKFSTIHIVTPFMAALVGLSLAESGYMAEIIRGGILAVDSGQRAAATALGLRRAQVSASIIMPQAARIILPSSGNQYISLLKSTSLASTIGYLEITGASQQIYSTNFKVLELLTIAAIWYLILAAVATGIQMLLERLYPVR